ATQGGRRPPWQNFWRSPAPQAVALVDQGLIACPAIVRRGSGTTRSRSRSMIRPKPRQLSHAPRGLLKENRFGLGSRTVKPQRAQARAVEKRRGSVPASAGT